MSNYSNVLKTENTVTDTKKNTQIYQPIQLTKQRLTSKFKRSSFEAWEHAYYRYIREMFDIFINGFAVEFPGMIDYISTAKFEHKFYRMLYNNSNGYICPNLEYLSESEREEYWEYLIKRDNS